MIDAIAQIALVIFGILCAWYAARGNALWACVFGLAGEPFWLITSVINRQAGIVLLSILYGGIWAVGLRRAMKQRGIK